MSIPEKIDSKRHIINIIFALCAVALIVFYAICGSSCSYLRGDIFGIDLKYAGIAFMAVFIALNVFRADGMNRLLLAAGVGSEAYLIGFQVKQGVFCPYCLAFGSIILALFIINLILGSVIRWKAAITAAAVLGFLIFLFFFRGSLIPTFF